jgi:hypothetical protein
MRQFVACRKCHHDRKRDPYDRVPEGFYRDPKTPGNVLECEHHVTWQRENDLFRRYVRNGFREDGWDLRYPEGYVGDRSRDNMYRLVKFVDVFKTEETVRRSTLYLEGPQGCQKTLLANWIGAELTRAGYDCRFFVMNDLIKRLTDVGWREGSNEIVDDVQRADLLIYDEAFDLDKLTLYKSNYQLPFLDAFLRTNLRSKANVFISNVGPDDISEKFGASIRDLILRETQYFDSRMEFVDNWRDNMGKIPERLF